MSGTTISDIPYEVLLYIFATASITPFSGPPRWETSTGKIPVTLAPKPIVEQSASYHPFSTKPFSIRSNEWAQTVQESLDTKRTIVLVCKEWMRLGTELLYEAIRIDHGSEALFKALERGSEIQQSGSSPTNRFELAKWVRRAEISTDMVDIDPFNPSIVWRILRSCPNLQTVVIPDLKALSLGRARWADDNESFAPNGPSTQPAFPNLTMIECYIPQTGGPTPPRNNKRVNHNFSGLLEQLLDHAPKLQHITLAGGRWIPAYSFSEQAEAKRYDFCSLTSLRVESDVGTLFQAEPDLIFQFPRLSHLIVGGGWGAVGPIVELCGEQISVLEILDIPPDRSINRQWHQPVVPPRALTIANLLEKCPNLQEFNIHFSLGDEILRGLNRQIGASCAVPQLQRVNINCETTLEPEPPVFERHMINLGVFFASHLEARNLEGVTLSGHGGKNGEWKWQHLRQKIKDCGSKYGRVRVEVADT
ncbi:hypothetical protein BJ165DRAFT_609915 [Panaeolus papilionaceus]|nr:hypothetical protein BJ165DRAFT_609915 [Panaeolus papilionaceus]